MSCMMLSARIHATVAETVAAIMNMGYNYFGFESPVSLFQALEDCADDFNYYDSSKIYHRLYILNNRAYNGRYKSNIIPLVPDMPTVSKLYEPRCGENHHDVIKPWHYKFAKLLDCLIYQLEEDATKKDPLVIALIEFNHNYRAFLVTNNDEYSRAPWANI